MQQTSVAEPTKLNPAEVVTRSGVVLARKQGKSKPSAKTAYMVLRNGRPYFYETINKWDKRAKEVKTVKRYLGTSLPRGYRLKE